MGKNFAFFLKVNNIISLGLGQKKGDLSFYLVRLGNRRPTDNAIKVVCQVAPKFYLYQLS